MEKEYQKIPQNLKDFLRSNFIVPDKIMIEN